MKSNVINQFSCCCIENAVQQQSFFLQIKYKAVQYLKNKTNIILFSPQAKISRSFVWRNATRCRFRCPWRYHGFGFVQRVGRWISATNQSTGITSWNQEKWTTVYGAVIPYLVNLPHTGKMIPLNCAVWFCIKKLKMPFIIWYSGRVVFLVLNMIQIVELAILIILKTMPFLTYFQILRVSLQAAFSWGHCGKEIDLFCEQPFCPSTAWSSHHIDATSQAGQLATRWHDILSEGNRYQGLH